jgi:hypothetical protein
MTDELAQRVGREVHNLLSRANVNAYLDMPEDTPANIARAIIPLIVERCAIAVERRERPREDHCCSAVYADCAEAIRNLGSEA